MKKELVIVTTDMEIELAMFVDVTKLTDTQEAVKEARERYYTKEDRLGLFDDVLFDVMNEYDIEFEIVKYEEI